MTPFVDGVHFFCPLCLAGLSDQAAATVEQDGVRIHCAACDARLLIYPSLMGWRIDGQVVRGIYHIETKKVNWAHQEFIVINLPSDFCTVDSDLLTTLVVLCHDRAVRCCVSAKNFNYLELMFHQRQRGGAWHEAHPTMEEAVARIRADRGLPIRASKDIT